jgi:hypothetical protein
MYDTRLSVVQPRGPRIPFHFIRATTALQTASCNSVARMQRSGIRNRILESQRAATFARVGAADEGSGFGVNHDRVGAAEAFGIAANDLMAAAG